MTNLIAIIENVIQGGRRTVEFSLPIGINDDTTARKMMMRIRTRMDNIREDLVLCFVE